MFQIPDKVNEESFEKSMYSRPKSRTSGKMKSSVSKAAHDVFRPMSLALVVF